MPGPPYWSSPGTYKEYLHIHETAIADHGDATIVGSFAWHVAQINAITDSTKRVGYIVFGPGVFTFTTLVSIHNDVAVAGSGPDITELNFSGAGGIQYRRGEVYAVNSTYVAGQQFIPSAAFGAFPNDVAFRCTVGGAVHASVEPTWPMTIGATVVSGAATFQTVDAPNFRMHNFSVVQASNKTGTSLKFFACNHGSLDYIKMTGGNATPVNDGIIIDSCNQVSLGNHLSFPGIRSNGLGIVMTNVVTFPYNFGDASGTRIDLAFIGTGSYGLMFKGDVTNKYINDVNLLSVKISGTGAVADVNIPILLWSAKRINLGKIDIDSCTVGVVEISDGTNICEFNGCDTFIFLPGAAQATEATPYSQGIPWSSACVTPYTTVQVRDKWMDFAAFSGWTNSQGTYTIQDDGGPYNRPLAVASAVQRNTPAGFTTLTFTTAIPTEQRDGAFTARKPSVHNTSNLSVGFFCQHLNGNVTEKAAKYIAGTRLRMGRTSAFNYQSWTLGMTANNIAVFRTIWHTVDGLKFTFPTGGACIIEPEITTGSVQLLKGKLEEFTVAGAPAASTRSGQIAIGTNDTTNGIVLIRSNGTVWQLVSVAANPTFA